MVLFVHDVTDILLEFTKLNVYMKHRNGKYYGLHDIISNIGFVTFTVAWFMFRLYWFPLKILYSTSVVAVYIGSPRGAGIYWFNFLISLLFVLDIYWFYVSIFRTLFFRFSSHPNVTFFNVLFSFILFVCQVHTAILV